MWDLGVFSSSHAHLEAEREMGDQSDRKKDRPTDRQTDRGRGEGGGGGEIRAGRGDRKREMEEEELGGVEIERGLGKRQRKGGRATKIDFKCLVVCNVCMYVCIYSSSCYDKFTRT